MRVSSRTPDPVLLASPGALTQAFPQASERAHGCTVAMSCPGCGARRCFSLGLGKCMLPTFPQAAVSISEQRVPWLGQGAENTLDSSEGKHLCDSEFPWALVSLWVLSLYG